MTQTTPMTSMTPEELRAVELKLHALCAHPLYEYTKTEQQRHGDVAAQPSGKYWEINDQILGEDGGPPGILELEDGHGATRRVYYWRRPRRTEA